jgi:hypothetical protein
MHRIILTTSVLAAFLSAGIALCAQTAENRGWLAEGIYLGGRVQYRIPQSTDYTTGFDGQPLFATATGDEFDTPMLTDALGYGAGFGFVYCEGRRNLAAILSADWSMSTGSGSSSVGTLNYANHEIDLAAEALYPLGAGLALSAQIGWNLDFFSIANGLLPGGGSRENLLLSSFVGFDIGGGLAYVVDRRLLIQAKYIFRLIGYNVASGSGASDSLDTEIGRGENALEFTIGWIIQPSRRPSDE